MIVVCLRNLKLHQLDCRAVLCVTEILWLVTLGGIMLMEGRLGVDHLNGSLVVGECCILIVIVEFLYLPSPGFYIVSFDTKGSFFHGFNVFIFVIY